ncbi:alpha/beta fold hydrolase [Arthrobacter sp. H20]|uniref:esterase/lipase family protein n=1 Tax=Arthrobacter sp. H20 TaxID=1267981 RepID=UPI00047B9C26|nr:alpha/beta fold hydrolase [Arthrobacter sp. H20]
MLLARRGWSWVLDYAYVGFWQVHGFLFREDPTRYLTPDPGPAGQTGPPVLLIPGIYETWQFMRPVAAHLASSGHPVHVVQQLGYNRGTVQSMARHVADYLSTHDLTDVVLVAHSKGGLIGKYVMTQPEGGERVRQLIAVNTPFSGSTYANFFVVPSIRAFSPRNRFLRTELANIGSNARITSVYSSFDPHIPQGSVLPGAVNIELATMGHFRIIGDRKLLGVLDRAIADR